MKTFKAICMAISLAFVLSVPVNAGDISTPGVTGCGETGVTAPATSTDSGTETVDSADVIGTSAFLELLSLIALY